MKHQRFSASVGRGLLALLYSVAPIEDAPPCDRTPWPPSLEEWCSAAGGASEVRLQHSGDQPSPPTPGYSRPRKPWILAYEPLWAADSLLARPSAVVRRDALNNLRTGSRTLHVAWGDIERLERRQGSLAGAGVGWGIAVGFIGLGVAALTCLGGEPYCAYPVAYWLIFGVPAAITIGAVSGATQARWVPVYCSPETQ